MLGEQPVDEPELGEYLARAQRVPTVRSGTGGIMKKQPTRKNNRFRRATSAPPTRIRRKA